MKSHLYETDGFSFFLLFYIIELIGDSYGRESEVGMMSMGNVHLHVGMRKLKSVLAVFIGFCIWQVIRLVVPGLEIHPIYIYIYGIIEMRETSEKTIDFGKRRIKATFTALLIGLPTLLLSVYLQSLASVEAVRIGIELVMILVGILVVLCIAEMVGCKNFCGLAAAILVILLVSHTDEEPMVYALLRSSQTVIGVAVAWLINVKWFPFYGEKKIPVEELNPDIIEEIK